MKPLLLLAGLVVLADPVAAGPWQPFTSLASSADGDFWVTGGVGGEVLYWEVSTGEVLDRWQLADRAVAGVTFNATGDLMGAILVDGRAFVLSHTEGTVQNLVPSASSWSSLAVAVARWRSAGPSMSGVIVAYQGWVARGFPDGRIVVSSTAGEVAWQAHTGAVTGLVWSPDGATLASCSFDGSLARWDSHTGKLLSRL